jgi:SWI/SNF-related matrix-associated actin-dependent regulator 1 of chromatin subfamily A
MAKEKNMQHPTVSEYKLKTYTSRYDNVTCGICRGKIHKGDEIACISPILSNLQALNMSAKVFKYSHLECLPLLISDEQMQVVREATDHLMRLTDPTWPEDFIGFDKPGAGMAQSWIEAGYPRLGAHRLAKHLTRFGKQLPAEQMDVIRKAASTKWEPMPRDTKADVEPDTWPNGWLKRERPAGRSEVFLGVRDSLVVCINKWQNDSHEAVYHALKKRRARWDGAAKCWVVKSAKGLTTGNLEDKLDIDTERTKVACSTKAWELLSAEPEAATEPTKKAQVAGVDCTVAPKDDAPEGSIRIEANGKGLKVHLDPPWVNPDHAVVKDRIKDLGARWDKDEKVWRVGASTLATKFDVLTGQIVAISEAALEQLQSVIERQKISSATDASSDEIKNKVREALPEGLDLYPFQYAGVEFLERSNGRAIIADDMGTGKTIQTAGYLALHPEQRPAVLVVPAVVTGNWLREIATWLPTEKVQWLAKGKTQLDETATIYVVTYDMLKKHLEVLKAREPVVVVGDEVHLTKNPKAARTKAFLELANLPSVKSFVGLSGTPIVNRPIEFYTFLSALNSDEFGNWFKYTERYCDGHWDQIYVKGGRGATKRVWKTGGATRTGELNQRLRSLMIRRRKQDVLTELPDKVYQNVEVEMNAKDRKAYKASINKDDIALAQITAARQAAGRIKVRHAVEWVEAHPDTPLLVFAHHQDVLNGLESGFQKLGLRVGRIDGSVSQQRRTELVEAFQAGELDIMVLSIKAAGVGITLTRASDVLFVEFSFTYSDQEQASDRAHRIGQKNCVTVHNMKLVDSIDADMIELLESKKEVLEAVLDGKQSADTNTDIRQELISRWENKGRQVK